MTAPMLDHALKFAAAGYFAFPCMPASKRPAISGWQQWATRDPAKITAHWSANPDHNIAIYTGRYEDGALIAVDVDEKGKGGGALLRQLESEGFGLPPTYSQTTPSGGKHFLFKVAQPVKPGVDVLGRGLDIRSRGSYVVSAGSQLKNGSYTTAEIIPPSPAPEWLVARCGRAVDRPTSERALVVAIDQGRAARHAIEFLNNSAKLAVEGAGGDNVTYSVAARVKDFGIVDEDVAWDLMLKHWNPRCSPPWEPGELRVKVKNAYAFGRNEPGVDAPEAAFGPVLTNCKAAHTASAPMGALHYELFRAVKLDLSKPQLVEGLLDHGAMSVMYGESNVGKSFIALDIGFHVAIGRTWHGRQVECGGVVYVAAEGGGSFRKRVVALRVHHNEVSADVAFALVPCSIDLSANGADVEPLIKLVRSAEQEMSQRCVLIVIDTLSRALGGANENAPDDMGAFVRNVDQIRNDTAAHLLIVHHSGKDRARGARGHSSLRAATDTELEISEGKIDTKKQRDMDKGSPIGFGLQQVAVGEDVRGAPVFSCVVTTRNIPTQDKSSARQVKLDSVAGKALAVLKELAVAHGTVHPMVWRQQFVTRHYVGNPKGGWTAFKRAVETLISAGHVIQEENHARVAA